MLELYLIFFGVGLLLFGGIVYYSVLQQRRQESPSQQEYVDPLFAELEEQKARKPESGAEVAAETTVNATPSASDAAKLAAAPTTVINAENADEALHAGAVPKDEKTAPSMQKPSSPSQAEPQKPVEREPTLDDGPEKASATANQETIEKASHSEKQAPAVKEKAPAVKEQAPAVKIEPQLGEKNAGQPTVQATAKPKVDKSSSTVLTDLVARIKNPEPIEQQGLLSLFRKHDFNFHRKVHIYGLNELTEMWRDIEFELPSARFTELGVSIQLADREGAMTKKELHDFQQMVLEFTNVYDAPFEFSMDIDEALKQASALDQIGRRYDSMAVLNVVPKSKAGFRMADIESCARDLMMSTDKNGVFMKTRGHKSNMSVLFRLACTDGSGQFGVSSSAAPVHDLVVYMNVPATEDPEKVFQDMVKNANSLATWLEGKVVDRAGRVMTQRSYSVLMQQVSDIAFSMQQDGLTPGDAISKKLF